MKTLPNNIRDVIRKLEDGLKALYGDRYRGLLLYGSYARGDAREGSDVDLLLLLEGPVDPVLEILHLEPVKWPLSLDADLALSVMPVSLEAFKRAESSFLRAIREEAVPAAA